MQQHLIQPTQFHDCAIVLFHELFHRQSLVIVPVAEVSGQFTLMVKQQTIFTASGNQVQTKAYLPEKGLSFMQGLIFVFRKKTVIHQFVQGFGIEVAFRHPADHLDIAQSAGAFLDIGLQVIGGVVKLVVPLLLFRQFGFEEFAAGPDSIRTGLSFLLFKQVNRADQQAGFLQVGGHGDILFGLLVTLFDAAHALPDLQTDIPQESQEAFNG